MSAHVSKGHRGGSISERVIRAAIPTVMRENVDNDRLAAVLAPRARRVRELYAGERQDLSRFISAEMVDQSRQAGCSGEIEDLCRAALVLNDLRLMRAVASTLVRDDASLIAEGRIARGELAENEQEQGSPPPDSRARLLLKLARLADQLIALGDEGNPGAWHGGDDFLFMLGSVLRKINPLIASSDYSAVVAERPPFMMNGDLVVFELDAVLNRATSAKEVPR